MNNIIRRLGVDKAVRYVILGKGISVLSGLVIMLLISGYLSKEAQGYYYTFNSVVALQIIFELGLSTVIIQFASHEMAGMKYDLIKNRISGDRVNKQRYLSLVRLALKWYGAIAILIVFIVGPIGYFFFSQEKSTMVTWQGPWFVLTIGTAINVFLISILSIAEGTGLVASVNKMRMYQALLAGILSIILLLAGEGLYATSSLAIAGIIVFTVFSYKYFKNIYAQAKRISRKEKINHISWSKEILPMQWRIALSWMSGYFIFFVMTPIAFKYFGATYAGRLGMSLTICNMVMATGLAWISTKYPSWGILISKQQIAAMNSSFKLAVIQSTCFVLVGLIGVYISLWILMLVHSNISDRFLGLLSFSYLAMAIIGNHIVACLATYIRAHKTEKMTTTSCIMAVLTVSFMLTVAFLGHEEYYVMVYALLTWLYFVPKTYFVYKKFKTNHE
ncbi:hypothetical protein [Buttiauxella ferragutiae]|uniref:hypothetical protein n=1 Tax=Buttiauxella ferragutiae TaxID=82989 RepID=UPI003526B81F